MRNYWFLINSVARILVLTVLFQTGMCSVYAENDVPEKRSILPAKSSVLFSSRTNHPASSKDPYDSFSAASSFHATGFWWLYSNDKKWMAEIKRRGYSLQGTLNSKLADSPGSTTSDAGRIVNEKGDKVTAPWMEGWNAWWGCANSPEYRRTFVEHAKVYIDAGADLLQMDDPLMNADALRWGGCYCRYCQEKAAKSGKTVKEIQKESLSDFYNYTRKEINTYAKRQVVISCNNYGGRPDFPFEFFDYGIAELSEKKAAPEYIYNAVRKIESMGKGQAFTFVSSDVVKTRSVIAVCYASGSHCIVPWDVYLPDQKKRYFGNPESYADLYGFVRSIPEYLDGFEDFFAVPSGVKKTVPADCPVEIIPDDDIGFYIRKKQSEKNISYVLHLVSWSGKNISVSIKLRSLIKAGRLMIVYPAKYDADLHAKAELSGSYQKLSVKKNISTDKTGMIHLDAPASWCIVIL